MLMVGFVVCLSVKRLGLGLGLVLGLAMLMLILLLQFHLLGTVR